MVELEGFSVGSKPGQDRFLAAKAVAFLPCQCQNRMCSEEGLRETEEITVTGQL